MQLYALFRLGIPSAPLLNNLTSLHTVTRRPVLQKVHGRSRYASAPEVLKLATYNRSPDRSTKSTISHLDVLYVLVGTGFQVLFHSPPGVLFTFPSQYYTLSVTG